MKKIFMTGAVALAVLSLSVTANASGQTDYALAKTINTQTEAQLDVENNRNMEYIRITRSNRLYEERWHDRSNQFERTDTFQVDGKIGQSQYVLNSGKRLVTIKYPSINVVRTAGNVDDLDTKTAQKNLDDLKKSYVEKLVAEFSWKETGEIVVLPDGQKSKKKIASKKLVNGTMTSTLYVDPVSNFPLKQDVTWDIINQGAHKITNETRTFEILETNPSSLFMLPLNITLTE